MKFEEVLPALRTGRKVRHNSWGRRYWITKDAENNVVNQYGQRDFLPSWSVLDDGWEIVPDSKRVADYLIEPYEESLYWYRQTYEIGKQPADAVLIPGTEREVGE